MFIEGFFFSENIRIFAQKIFKVMFLQFLSVLLKVKYGGLKAVF